ncbi:MAG: hypothetical protein LBM59_02625 [Ruminococcus sp.]|jgi:hypothetical protein|nr:hypothetical protein [Ruminococcus sp.]
MVKKVLYGILFSITLAMVGLCFRIIPAINEITDGEATAVDIYNIPPSSRQSGKMIDITVDSVLLDGGYDEILDAAYYVVPAGIPGKDTVMLMIVMVSDETRISEMTALSLNPEAASVTLTGYFSDIPESNKEQLISGFVTGGLSRPDAEQFYKDNIVPAMFVESSAVKGIMWIGGYILIGITAVLVIITVLISIRRYKKPDVSYSQPAGGYIPPQSSSPNGYRPPSSGGYVPGGYKPPTPNSGGYVPPAAANTPRRPYVHPGEEPPLTDEYGNPFDPTKIKQPDYADFFGDKKPKPTATATPRPPEKKKPDKIDDFYTVEMEALPLPNLPAAPVSDGDNYSDFLELPSSDEINATLNDNDGIVSEMDLNEYMSADYLSADFTPDNPDD